MTVGVVGLGLIGGSVGLALRDPSRTLIGCDVNEAEAQVALGRFCVDRLAPFEEVMRADVVFLAVPPSVVLTLLPACAAARGPDTVVTDCTSVKGEVAALAAKAKYGWFVPGHPMAGHEKSGSAYASAWMYRGARWIVTPLKSTTTVALRQVESLVKDMGAVPVRLDPASHDRHVAILSHLPHALAAALVEMGAGLAHTEVSAGSWKDVTRVGGVDPDLWTQIFLGNRQELAAVLDEFRERLGVLAKALREDDATTVRNGLERAQSIKNRQLPPRSGAAAGPKPDSGLKRVRKRPR